VVHRAFHNIDLLAGIARGGAPLRPSEAVARCLLGLGGPCHVQAFGLHALLNALAFEADLCGAQVRHAEDHLVVRVDVGGRRFVCDVGNGQPYLRPFPVDRELSQEHLGWVVVSRPDAEGIEVERSSPDQPVARRVYRASLRPRSCDDFADSIRRHHAEAGFGPFMTGLRAVRIGRAEMVALRDHVRTRYRAGGYDQTTLDRAGVARCLSDELGLRGLPIDAALRAWPA
jgi:arylamine N-acetyltransferase